MSKPQLNHLSNLMYSLIAVYGNKSIYSVSKAILSAKDSSSIYKFLSKSIWDDSIINRNRIFYLNLVLKHHVESDSIGFLIIDDTINPKPSAKEIKYSETTFEYGYAEGTLYLMRAVYYTNKPIIEALYCALQK